ncbi:MAG TPA: hypothetical protein PK052_02565 [Anaerohalosphaeraceae bacterium]|nr:hypothetical protein [Phycisphaerae bacterium]HOK94847.1 hypothetical protein [Anaerohalosphaeraceae bacterium]HOL30839.1 hypothetical protein [Anaerohalosphaeraceae bacterium]HOM75808.1 hypothetical protein [Anaerohalosphaeraceae bacterium]HPC64559.1 hypothetical protein [Anaerohalosphaeraceae bacterium]
MKTVRQNILPQKEQTGSVLVLVLVIVMVCFIIGTSVLLLGTQSRMASLDQIQDMEARLAADAGVERAVQEINNAVIAKTWSADLLPSASGVEMPFSNAIYSVTTTYDSADGYRIASTGIDRNRSRTVRAALRLKGLFDNAIQCRNNIILKSGTVVQSVDSNVSLNPDDCSQKVIIGTNSTEACSIILNNNVVVDGDVVVGFGGDVARVIKDQGAIFDRSYALSSTLDFPQVSPPPLLGPNTKIEVKTGEKTIGPGGDFPAGGRFSSVKLGQGATLRVIGDCTLYITGTVDMGQNSEILLDPAYNASLTVYLDGNWISDNNSGINNAIQIPSRFKLYGTGPIGQKIDLKAKTDAFGVIYAPNADLTVYSGGNIYGSFVANNFELKSPANFYYDAALKTVSVTDEGARFVISRWNEE